jgi:hypothetical protein
MAFIPKEVSFDDEVMARVKRDLDIFGRAYAYAALESMGEGDTLDIKIKFVDAFNVELECPGERENTFRGPLREAAAWMMEYVGVGGMSGGVSVGSLDSIFPVYETGGA